VVTPADILHGHILIVDDQVPDTRLLELILRSAGYARISSTTDARAVCALHRDNHFDLILLDLQMPGMDGFEVMEGLKAIETDGYIPVLVITAQPGHQQRALQAGAKDFLSKPYNRAEVLMRVHNLLEVRLLYRHIERDNEMLESMALHDQLTGLANRRLLADRLSMALVHARRNKSAMAVLYLDLDGFKELNDQMGHGAGDSLLKMVAARLLETVREEDTVARPGGDEFILVLWHIERPEYAATVARKVIEALALPFDIEGNAVSISTSAGVGIYPVHGEDGDTLIASADLALYEAKHAGKNAYRISTRTRPWAAASSPAGPPASGVPLPDAPYRMKGGR
jgi:two-component system, cell cycle response regulator